MLVWNSTKVASGFESNKVDLPPLVPPFRFNIVEGGNRNDALYRSAFPTDRNFRFLKRLKLRTMISLIPRDMMTENLQQFCKSNHINHIIIPASGTQKPLDASHDDPNGPGPTHALCAQILTMCIDKEKLPLLIHDTNGAHVTGLIIALLRKLQHHTMDSYLEEFMRFTKNHTLNDDEKVFIARYFSAVTLPGSLPSWLWGGERPTRHPTMPLFAAALSVGLSPDDAEEDKDFSPPILQTAIASSRMDSVEVSSTLFRGEVAGGHLPHHHHHRPLVRSHSAEASAELLSMLGQEEPASTAALNEGLRGMSVEDPGSVMRRRA